MQVNIIKKNKILKSMEYCLKDCSLERMSQDLYRFFHEKCGYLPFANRNAFASIGESPDGFESFIKMMKNGLEKQVKQSDKNPEYKDNTDSYKRGYNFSIPETKKEMLSLINRYEYSMNKQSIDSRLEALYWEREKLDKKILELEAKQLPDHIEIDGKDLEVH